MGNKKFLFIVLCLVLILGGTYFYQHSAYFQTQTALSYQNLRDYSPEYNARLEIEGAKAALPGVTEPAKIITAPTGYDKHRIILTFDGLADRGTIEAILAVLKKNHQIAAFFVEGQNVIMDPKLVTLIAQDGNTIGDYGFLGLGKGQTLTQDQLIEEFCKGQKVLKVVSGKAPDIFKMDDTVYQLPLLAAAKASGLSYAVQSSVFVPYKKIYTDLDAQKFVTSLKPGMVVSVKLGVPPDIIDKTKKVEDRPAIDKKPTIKDTTTSVPPVPVAEGVQRFCTALKQAGYETAPIGEFAPLSRAVSYTTPVALAPLSEAQVDRAGGSRLREAAQPIQFSSLEAAYQTISSLGTKIFGCSVAYAARQDLSAGVSDSYLAGLRTRNQGKLAVEEKMLYTTAQKVPFTFVGFTRADSLEYILQTLDTFNTKGTFFVNERELQRYGDNIAKIAAAGHELGIAVYPKAGEDFNSVCRDVLRVHNELRDRYGQDTRLVRQFSGPVQEVTREAVSALGMRLIGTTVNVVQSRHKDYQTAEQVMPEIFGKSVYSLGRGWIVNLRTDFYTNPHLAADLLSYIKREKIDNIAYNEYNDIAGVNPANDSAYRTTSISNVLADAGHAYTYPVPKADYLPQLQRYPLLKDDSKAELMKELSKRYIGEKTVTAGDRTLGFTEADMNKLDQTGLVKTDRPVVFLTFDDWGTDVSLNKLLYVLRKHNVKATFFVLTNNVLNNPNLLRAVAQEGHNIGSHTNLHKAMVVRDPKTKKEIPTMTYEVYYKDLNTSFEKMEEIIGDVSYQGRPMLTKYFRPPTLAISRMGARAILENGFDFIVSGSTSTHDYDAKDLKAMVLRIRDGLYFQDKVRKGAIFVMHMSDTAKYTAVALDIVLTANERKSYDDPTRFEVGRLSDYLTEDYSQAPTVKEQEKKARRIRWW